MLVAGIDVEQLRLGVRRPLAKAITLVESSLERDRQAAQNLLHEVLPYTGKSLRIGISGTPGVGKSTFIESFGQFVLQQGKKLAVLAVDPSSPKAGGSILGDKTRMEQLAREANAYIRPSPSSGELGGVALKTRESILLCEAAGFDVIVVETVGVGQSEFDVAGMVDFFLVLMQPYAGDELQGIKKGIMELADLLVINKADGESEHFAKQAKSHYQNAIHLMASNDDWQTQVLTCSALHNTGIENIWQVIQAYVTQAQKNNRFQQRRLDQNRAWMDKLFIEMMQLKMQSTEGFVALKSRLQKDVVEGKTTPLSAAQTLLKMFDRDH